MQKWETLSHTLKLPPSLSCWLDSLQLCEIWHAINNQQLFTYESPRYWWSFILPAVVSASKSGNGSPSSSPGMMEAWMWTWVGLRDETWKRDSRGGGWLTVKHGAWCRAGGGSWFLEESAVGWCAQVWRTNFRNENTIRFFTKWYVIYICINVIF